MNILITGGASGIGRGLVEYFSTNHAVTVVDLNPPIDISNIQFISLNLLDHNQLSAFCDTALRYDVLINCAGTREIVPPHALHELEWRKVLELNLTVPFLLSQSQIQKALKEKKPLAIVNMASISGLQAEPDRCAYVSSKFGLIGLTKQLAFQYGKNGIRVNAVCPGVIETPMTEQYFSDSKMVENIKEATPVGYWGKVAHIVPLVEQCITNSYLNGSSLVCDGGWTAGKSL